MPPHGGVFVYLETCFSGVIVMAEETTWLTQEAYDRLLAELEELVGEKRAEITKRIQDAREEGDLKENGGYHAAKEEQGKIEARIFRLQSILGTAVVGETSGTSGVVSQGSVVKVNLRGNETEFLLGNAEIAEGFDLTVYSPSSPIGQAIMGRIVGETVSYWAPNGKEISVEILDVRWF
jgi:transcription elongation factor GreA